MHRRIVSLLATGALVTSLGVLVVPGVALAADPPPPATAPVAQEAPVPVISPTSGPPGTVIAVSVPGCTTGFIAAGLGNLQTEDLVAFEVGAAPTVNLTVPADAAQGQYVVVAGCNIYTEGDVNGAPFTVTAGAVVAQPHVTG